MRRIQRLNCQLCESDKESAPESISDTGNWRYWNGDLDTPNNGEEDCKADNVFDVKPDNDMKASDSSEHRDLSTALFVPRLIRLTRSSMDTAEKGSITVSAMETRQSAGNNKKLD